MFYAYNATGGVTRNVAYTGITGGTSMTMNLLEFSGFDSGVTLDQTAGSDFSSADWTGNNITPSVAASVAIEYTRQGSSFSLNSRGDGFGAISTGTRVVCGQVVLAATTTIDGDLHFAASEDGCHVLANFYTPTAASAVPLFVHQLKTQGIA